MNNGRDCEHGRRVGNCDSCDLVQAEKRIADLEKECKRLEENLNSKTEIANQLKDSLSESFARELTLKSERDMLAHRLNDVSMACELSNRMLEKTVSERETLVSQVERWKSEYIGEVRKHVRLHNEVYSGAFSGRMPEGKIYSEDYLVDDAVNVIESEIGETPHLVEIRANAVLSAADWLSENYPHLANPSCGLLAHYVSRVLRGGEK